MLPTEFEKTQFTLIFQHTVIMSTSKQDDYKIELFMTLTGAMSCSFKNHNSCFQIRLHFVFSSPSTPFVFFLNGVFFRVRRGERDVCVCGKDMQNFTINSTLVGAGKLVRN